MKANSLFFQAVIVPLSILLPIFIAAVRYKNLNRQSKVLFGYLILTGITNGIFIIVGRYFHVNNLPFLHIYTAIEMIILNYYYRIMLGRGDSGKMFIVIPVVFVMLCIANALYLQDIHTYNSYTRSVEAIVCILFSLNYFAKLASDPETGNVIRLSDFYANTGIFLYYSGAFILFVFSNFIITKLSLNNFLIIWNIHAALILLMYQGIAVSFLLCKK